MHEHADTHTPGHEAHPELAFAAPAGSPMAHRKPFGCGPGRAARRPRPDGTAPGPARGAALDDVLDRWCLRRTAARYVDGTALVLGDGSAGTTTACLMRIVA